MLPSLNAGKKLSLWMRTPIHLITLRFFIPWTFRQWTMDLSNLSTNWKRLQASLKASNTIGFSATKSTSSQRGVKRKRHPSHAARKSPVEVTKPRKRIRVSMNIAQDVLSSSRISSIQQAEESDGNTRPRLPDLTASYKVNAGLSST